jgi:cytidylate kinase
MQQQNSKGEITASLAADLRERDRRDRTRAASPLEASADAIIIDSTNLGEAEVLAQLEELVKAKVSQ